LKNSSEERFSVYSDRGASVEDAPPSNDPFSGIHSNGSDNALAQMLSDFQHQSGGVIQNLERSQDRRQTLVKSDINDGTNNLANLPDRALPSELIGDLPTTANFLLLRRRRRRSGSSSSRGGVLRDTVEQESVRRSTLGGRESGCRCGN